jgi:hypothetical protein
MSTNVSPVTHDFERFAGNTYHDMAKRSIAAQPPHWGAAGRRWLIYHRYCHRPSGSTNVRMTRASSASVPVAQSAAAAGVAPGSAKVTGLAQKLQVGPIFLTANPRVASSWPNFWANPVTFTLTRPAGHYYGVNIKLSTTGRH